MPDSPFILDGKPLSADLDNDGILRLTLNDPETRNSLSESMLNALGSTLDAAANDPAVRVVVLAAAGPVFCAGCPSN